MFCHLIVFIEYFNISKIFGGHLGKIALAILKMAKNEVAEKRRMAKIIERIYPVSFMPVS